MPIVQPLARCFFWSSAGGGVTVFFWVDAESFFACCGGFPCPAGGAVPVGVAVFSCPGFVAPRSCPGVVAPRSCPGVVAIFPCPGVVVARSWLGSSASFFSADVWFAPGLWVLFAVIFFVLLWNGPLPFGLGTLPCEPLAVTLSPCEPISSLPDGISWSGEPANLRPAAVV